MPPRSPLSGWRQLLADLAAMVLVVVATGLLVLGMILLLGKVL